MHRSTRPRGADLHPPTAFARTRILPLVRLTGAGTLVLAFLTAGPATASESSSPAEPCSPTSVTVVVDSTELGGGIDVGCADAGGSGTDALHAAGFTEARDASGYLCAIDARPDPCPAEFTGSYWSYWHASGDQWQSYEVGSDTSAPEAGGVEGWRYGDGSTTPDVVPTAAVPTTVDVSGDDGATHEEPTATEGVAPTVALGVGLVAVVLIAVLLLARRRSSLPRGDGPAGQD